ncbi:copper resistance protein CopC [Nonomuraea sp. NPDC048892]|uniref:copper resistance protein CopC n=1 Tax=Nonomuraea sp. NPDC048892 TaxID=3154624 RepID=UPI0033D6D125
MRRLLTVLLLALAAVGVAGAPAQAHNVLISSDPRDGSTLAASPERVTLVFDQAVRQGYAQVGVTGADGSSWADGSPEVAAERVSVKVRPLPGGGSYTVGYRILSADGHPVTGKISFTLAAGASAVTTGQAAPAAPTGQAAPAGQTGAAGSAEAAEAAANGGAGMAVVWIVGALLVLAAGTAVALRRSGAPRPAPAVASAEGTGAESAGPAATGAVGTGAEEAGPEETGAEETGAEETGAEETGAEETAAGTVAATATGVQEASADRTRS